MGFSDITQIDEKFNYCQAKEFNFFVFMLRNKLEYIYG